jgi:hypothetical protein
MKEAGELSRRVRVRSSQYLNNLIEQGHRRVKQRIRPMLGFKRFDNAAVTISGIELAEKIKKVQFQTGTAARANLIPEFDSGLDSCSRTPRPWPQARVRIATMSALRSAALAA